MTDSRPISPIYPEKGPPLCPVCREPVEAEFVDIGVGMERVTPYACPPPGCGWVEPYGDELMEMYNDYGC